MILTLPAAKSENDPTMSKVLTIILSAAFYISHITHSTALYRLLLCADNNLYSDLFIPYKFKEHETLREDHNLSLKGVT
jgi:hypothetical protein